MFGWSRRDAEQRLAARLNKRRMRVAMPAFRRLQDGLEVVTIAQRIEPRVPGEGLVREEALLDDKGHYTRAGSEVRIYAPGTRKVLGTRIVDTGSGYCSQNAMPVHFGLPSETRIDVEVTSLTRAGRKITSVPKVDPDKLPRRVLVVRIDADGNRKTTA